MKRLATMVAIVSLLGCTPSLDDQQEKISRFAKANRYGSSSDMWLVRAGMLGPERVALIYGFAPDSGFCFEVAEMYMQKYPDGAGYTCEPAN